MNPIFLRLPLAAEYVGMSVPVFNKDVRPYVRERKRGEAISFYRIDLDQWAEQDIQRNGKPAAKQLPEEQKWQKQHQDLESVEESGTSKKRSARSRSTKAPAQVISLKQSAYSKLSSELRGKG